MVPEPATVSVRPARPADVSRLQAIQLAAGSAFRNVGLAVVAEGPALAESAHAGYRAAGRAWVAVDEHDEPVGFVVADVVDGCAHIEQVSVHPAHARQRIGATLLDHVARWAAQGRLRALTLITFRGVPWNAPYYERLGFHELAETEITPGLTALRLAGPSPGGDGFRQVCMRRDLTPDGSLASQEGDVAG
jgi:GNAT superfamily N-acetyltransferase